MELVLKTNNQGKLLRPLVFLVAHIIFACIAFSDYFISDSNVFIAMVLSPLILTIDKSSRTYRYLIPATIFTLLSILTGVRSILFLSFIFSLLLLVDSMFGKTSWTLLFLLFVISPIFKFIAMTFGFPIRLFLSKMSAQILSLTGKDVTAIGNIINAGGSEFSVDPACVGLSMITISFILMLFIISHFQRRTGKSLSFINCISLFSITFALNIVCNLIRIITLVQFSILPGSIMHDVTGIICLFAYVVLPVYGIIHLYFKGAKIKPTGNVELSNGFRPAIVSFVIFCTLLISFIKIDKSIPAMTPDTQCHIEGYSMERLKTGVIQFKNANGLIYIKPMNFYNAEHNPLICWSGSGYEFKSYGTQPINGIEIYSGVIQKGEEKIYSAWWFDNGHKKTISQFEWRFDAITGNQYCLVNANANSKQELNKMIMELLKKNIFLPDVTQSVVSN